MIIVKILCFRDKELNIFIQKFFDLYARNLQLKKVVEVHKFFRYRRLLVIK